MVESDENIYRRTGSLCARRKTTPRTEKCPLFAQDSANFLQKTS